MAASSEQHLVEVRLMTASSEPLVCSTVPSVRILGMGIGFFLYILLILVSISVFFAVHEGSRVSLFAKVLVVHALFLGIIFGMPKKSVTVEECGPAADSQGLLAMVMLLILLLTMLLASACVFKVYMSRPIYAVTKEDRATGHTTAEAIR